MPKGSMLRGLQWPIRLWPLPRRLQPHQGIRCGRRTAAVGHAAHDPLLDQRRQPAQQRRLAPQQLRHQAVGCDAEVGQALVEGAEVADL